MERIKELIKNILDENQKMKDENEALAIALNDTRKEIGILKSTIKELNKVGE